MSERRGRKHEREDDGRAGRKLRRVLSPSQVEAIEQAERRERELEEAATARIRARAATAGEEDAEWEDCTDDDEDAMIAPPDDDGDGEEVVVEDDDDGEGGAVGQLGSAMRTVRFADAGAAGGDEEEGEGEGEEEAPRVWRSDLAGGTGADKLDYASRAYDCFFQLQTEYPALSFDVIRDNEEGNRTRYPLTMYLVCGSQADEGAKNNIYVLRVSNLLRTKHDQDSDDESEDSYIGDAAEAEDDDDEGDDVGAERNNGEPVVEHRTIAHHGAANRLKCCAHDSNLLAVWSDAGHVQIFSLQSDVAALADFANWSREQAANFKNPRPSPLRFCSPGSTHRVEGYALDWNRVAPRVLASGDCNGDMFVWNPTDSGRWAVACSATGTKGATSVEDIKWSPTQADVLVAARAGGHIEVWDGRDMRRAQVRWAADATDINVVDWNSVRQASHLLVSGADSGAVAVWDLRRVRDASPQPIQALRWHRGRITSVEFSTHNESVLAVTGDDGQCTLWDLSLERDTDEERAVIGELFGREDLTNLPDQLMFQHLGLVHPKEVHFHGQVPGMVVTTDYNGLHLFKPMNWRSLMK